MGNIKPPKLSTKYKAIIKRLIEAREAAGLSQLQTSKLCGVAPASFCDIENFRNQLSVERLLNLCGIYGVSIEWVMTGVNPAFDPVEFIEAVGVVNKDAVKLMNLLNMQAAKTGKK